MTSLPERLLRACRLKTPVTKSEQGCGVEVRRVGLSNTTNYAEDELWRKRTVGLGKPTRRENCAHCDQQPCFDHSRLISMPDLLKIGRFTADDLAGNFLRLCMPSVGEHNS